MCSAVTAAVPVADEQVDVLAPRALGPEGCPREARGYREEVDRAAIARREDGRQLHVGHVDARDGEVGFPAASRVPSTACRTGKGAARIRRDDGIAEPQLPQLRPPRHPPRCRRCAPWPPPGGPWQAHRTPLFPRAEDHHDSGARRHQPGQLAVLAPATSSAARATCPGISAGILARAPLAKRTASPVTSSWALARRTSRTESIRSGVRERETSDATRSPGARAGSSATRRDPEDAPQKHAPRARGRILQLCRGPRRRSVGPACAISASEPSRGRGAPRARLPRGPPLRLRYICEAGRTRRR